jgi:hypothetical protein
MPFVITLHSCHFHASFMPLSCQFHASFITLSAPHLEHLYRPRGPLESLFESLVASLLASLLASLFGSLVESLLVSLDSLCPFVR